MTYCMTFRRIFPRTTLLAVIAFVFCTGAAEFPAFRMKEFEENTNKPKLFKEKVPEVEVPPVSKRVYGGQEKRLPVFGVVIDGIVPYPKRGITRKKIQAIIDKRYNQEKGIDLDDNGFTKGDYAAIGHFLREMMDRGGWDQDDLNNLVKLIQKQNFERGWITVEQLDNIAQAVTDYYREQGFILATAFVPQQEVKDGVVHLKVLEGRLGNVTVSNNQIFADRTLSAPLDYEIGKPVTEEGIESALRRINDLPGVRVRGSFSPGHDVGETTLNLGVLHEQSWTSSILVDNHGSPTTGAVRMYATAQWLNLRNKGQTLMIGALRSQGSKSTYGIIQYGMPVLPGERGRLQGTISSNQFAVNTLIGTSRTDVTGESQNVGLSATYQFVRSRTFNLSAGADYTRKHVLFNVEKVSQLDREQKIGSGGLSIDYNQLWDKPQLLLQGHLGFEQANIFYGAVGRQSTTYTRILFNANLLKRFSLHNWFTKKQSSFNIVFKLNGQYSDKFLPSIDQFSLGGPNAVKAFTVSDVSVDSGAYAGFELFFNPPFNINKLLRLPLDPVRPYLFYDYGYGVVKNVASTINQDAVLKAYGIGLRLSWPGHGAADFVFAKPQAAHFDDNFSTVKGKSRVYFDLTYQIK